MDALSEALLAVRTTGAIFIKVECIAPWGFAVPDVYQTADLLAPGTGRIVNYHLVTEGRALVRLEGKEAFWAEAGDIVILPYGDAHTVSNGRPSRYVDSAVAPGQLFTARPGTIRLGGGEGETTRIICGFIGCQRSADRLFLSGLPHSIRIKLGGEPSDSWLTRTIEHLVCEAEADQPGASILLSRAAESIFVDALRRFMRGLSPEHTGWLAAARDTVVGAALATLHRAPARSWTIQQLAREAGSSPSALNIGRKAGKLSEALAPPPRCRQTRQHARYGSADRRRCRLRFGSSLQPRLQGRIWSTASTIPETNHYALQIIQ